jgi:hypothetical protein
MKHFDEHPTLWLTIIMVIAIIIVLLSGCTRMTHQEQLLFGGMIVAQAADYETTRKYIAIGGTEGNPLMSDRPDDGEILLFKAGVTGVLWLCGEIWPEQRKAFYTVGIISGSGVAGWNDRLYEKYKL